MKEFDFGNYKGKYAMHCKTEKEAKEFCKVMHDAGREWCNGTSYIRNECWDVYEAARKRRETAQQSTRLCLRMG